MDANDFVSGIKIAVGEASVKSTISTLLKPGKRAGSTELEESQWFQQLGGREKEYVKGIIKRAVNYSVFNFFCVLDGVATVEGPGPKGTFDLFYSKGSDRILLNDDKGEELHTLFKRVE